MLHSAKKIPCFNNHFIIHTNFSNISLVPQSFPQGDARDECPPVRQDIDAHRCGASAYGAGECVSGGGDIKNMGVHPIFHAHPYYNFPNYKSITMSSTRIDANDNGGCLDNWYRRRIHPWKLRF